jgi:Flp pilus assembly pilin Flp
MAGSLGVLLARLRLLSTDETAQDLVEYSLLVALVSVGAISSMKALGAGISALFSHTSTTLAAE